MKAIALALAVACTTVKILPPELPIEAPKPIAPVPAPAPEDKCIGGLPGETRVHLMSRILVDACTSEPTDEVMIEHGVFVLGFCQKDLPACVRDLCVRLRSEDLNRRRSVALARMREELDEIVRRTRQDFERGDR